MYILFRVKICVFSYPFVMFVKTKRPLYETLHVIVILEFGQVCNWTQFHIRPQKTSQFTYKSPTISIPITITNRTITLLLVNKRIDPKINMLDRWYKMMEIGEYLSLFFILLIYLSLQIFHHHTKYLEMNRIT